MFMSIAVFKLLLDVKKRNVTTFILLHKILIAKINISVNHCTSIKINYDMTICLISFINYTYQVINIPNYDIIPYCIYTVGC